ncbi:hypothetical protein CAL28_23220 [Bordetella genomosp. 11]|uniref:Uncharacterized protein n=1 Tax=Bordetella genomosp. 11 TaxID=1416808 RepID=A0A261UJR8_9BORD|nr:hypothetical protein CAL28_23220 [Bordetella genomosp. 11]
MGVLYLISANELIAYDERFRGTLGQAPLYPRESVKAVQQLMGGTLLDNLIVAGNAITSLVERQLTSCSTRRPPPGDRSGASSPCALQAQGAFAA